MRPEPRLPYTWGATPRDLDASYPCDAYLPDADEALMRAAHVAAPAATVFRWLCQLRAAPYSYDWLDNAGRTSPRRLTHGLEDLVVGQTFMSIFELVEFEAGRHVTLRMAKPSALVVFGAIAGSYVAEPVSDASTRLIVKLAVRYPRRPPWSWIRHVLPWGDLVMMRKQLLTLKKLAETM